MLRSQGALCGRRRWQGRSSGLPIQQRGLPWSSWSCVAGLRPRRVTYSYRSRLLAIHQGQHIGTQEFDLVSAIMSAVVSAPRNGGVPWVLPEPGIQGGIGRAGDYRREADTPGGGAAALFRCAEKPYPEPQNPAI